MTPRDARAIADALLGDWVDEPTRDAFVHDLIASGVRVTVTSASLAKLRAERDQILAEAVHDWRQSKS